MRATPEPDIHIGNHVKIVGVHPWSGAIGEVIGMMRMPFSRKEAWEVQLDGGGTGIDGHRCCVDNSNLKVI